MSDWPETALWLGPQSLHPYPESGENLSLFPESVNINMDALQYL